MTNNLLPYKSSTPIHFYKREDHSSIDIVGGKIFEQMKEHGYSVELRSANNVNKPEINPVDVGIVYGLVRDLKKLSRYKIKVAGLVCEEELTPHNIELIEEADLDQIWVPSEFVANFFVQAGFTEKVTVVPHGIDDSPIIECKNNGERFVGLMIYNSYNRLNDHVKRKNPFKAVEAVNSLNGSLDLLLRLKTKHQGYYNKYDLKRVEFIDQYFENVDELYRECNFVLYPSDSEGFGLIGLECLMRGIPLISTKTGNDYLDKDIEYVHIELPVTVEKIKAAILKMVSNYQYYRKQSIQQRDLLYSRFSWPEIGKKVDITMSKIIRKIYGVK